MISSPVVLVYRDGIFSIICAVIDHLRPPNDFLWTLNNTIKIDYGSYRQDGLLMEKTVGQRSSTSKLTIVRAQHNDSGVYHCQPTGLYKGFEVKKDRVEVRVMERPKSYFLSDGSGVRGCVNLYIILSAFQMLFAH